MATGQQNGNLDYYFEVDDDSDSDTSLELEDIEHPIERILAEFTGRNNHVWYLVKWKDCPVVRSSWECVVIFADTQHILKEWQLEKQRQREGKSKPFDITAFNKAVLDVEITERQRRRLRHLRKAAEKSLAAIESD